MGEAFVETGGKLKAHEFLLVMEVCVCDDAVQALGHIAQLLHRFFPQRVMADKAIRDQRYA